MHELGLPPLHSGDAVRLLHPTCLRFRFDGQASTPDFIPKCPKLLTCDAAGRAPALHENVFVDPLRAPLGFELREEAHYWRIVPDYRARRPDLEVTFGDT
jgi:hypothetical protein